MRAMWNEFDSWTGENVFDVYTQFMFGSDILVAPKVKTPTDVLKSMQM